METGLKSVGTGRTTLTSGKSSARVPSRELRKCRNEQNKYIKYHHPWSDKAYVLSDERNINFPDTRRDKHVEPFELSDTTHSIRDTSNGCSVSVGMSLWGEWCQENAREPRLSVT